MVLKYDENDILRFRDGVLEERDTQGKVREKLYLVRETKFVSNLDNLRPSEKHKIKCAEEQLKKEKGKV